MRNRLDAVELKLELRDPALARSILRSLGAVSVAPLGQADTHYRVARGRVLRRQADGAEPEFLVYERADAAYPRVSRSHRYTAAQAQERFGEAVLPVLAEVRTRREVHVLGAARAHLDEVEGLGWFLELVAPISREHDEAACHVAVHDLRQALGPALGEPLSVSYADLVAAL